MVEADLVDPALTPLGHRQANATADYLADAKIDAMYVSPQQRARQTIEPLAARHQIEPVVDARIAEYDYETGAYVPTWLREGMTREETTAKFLEDMGPPFQSRVTDGFNDIITNNPGRTVAVVCHAGVIGTMMQDLLRTSAWMLAHHASITRIAANRKGTRSLVTFNEHNWVPTE